MKASIIEQIASEITEAYLSRNIKVNDTPTAYGWVSINPLDEGEKTSKNVSVFASADFDGICIRICVKPTESNASDFNLALQSARSRNYCLQAAKAKMQADELGKQADQWLTKAAKELGVPVEEVKLTTED